MDDERTVWEGHASHLVNLPAYLLCALAAGALLGGALFLQGRLDAPVLYGVAGAALIPAGFAFAKWLQNRCRRYEFTTERLRLRRGVFSRQTDEVELYRVKDYVLVEPFWRRLFGLGDIVVKTTDDANPTVHIQAIPEAPAVRDQLRKHVELCRERKNVRITEFEG